MRCYCLSAPVASCFGRKHNHLRASSNVRSRLNPLTILNLLLLGTFVCAILFVSAFSANAQSGTVRFAIIGDYGSDGIPERDVANRVRKLPSYSVFSRDRAWLVGGASIAQSQLNLARLFVQRPEFIARYPLTQDANAFIGAILDVIRIDTGADLTSQFNALLGLYNGAGSQAAGRAVLLYLLADDNILTNPINNLTFIAAERSRALVAAQYFGYLRRDPDIAGFLFWLRRVNQLPGSQNASACAFITSLEYQLRFSSVATHSNRECVK